jgi:hypothetical protein
MKAAPGAVTQFQASQNNSGLPKRPDFSASISLAPTASNTGTPVTIPR